MQAPIRISAIYIQELEDDGLSFLPGSKPEILLQDDQSVPHYNLMFILTISITRQEELLIVEGPWLMYKQGKYYLFYSSSWVQLPSYHIGVARASSVVGPYTKRNIPVLQNDWDRYVASNFLTPCSCPSVYLSVLDQRKLTLTLSPMGRGWGWGGAKY